MLNAVQEDSPIKVVQVLERVIVSRFSNICLHWIKFSICVSLKDCGIERGKKTWEFAVNFAFSCI